MRRPLVPLPVRKLFVVLLVALTADANEVSYRSLQSGSADGPTPLHDRGLRGEGQIVAVLDTGADYLSCYLAEPDGSLPPFNTGSPSAGLAWENVDLTRRKIVAYDFLYSCDQYPGLSGCDTPGAPGSSDNQGHGTRSASIIAGDKGAPLVHDWADAIAPAAKLVIQDGGYKGGDSCTQFPGVGCPARLTPIFEQAYRQGARIHSNSWGDRQGSLSSPPTANYPQSARDIDAFVFTHPDMLVVFNTGNLGQAITTPSNSLSAPGSAKNTLQIGGTRTRGRDDDVISEFTLFGPSRDGRIKPDLVGPSRVTTGDASVISNGDTCDTSRQPGTSWASPSIAGAAALVRQYYIEGFHTRGVRNTADGFTPSAALMKATLIGGARALRWRMDYMSSQIVEAEPVPSREQGWGFPVLDDVLYFAGDAERLVVADVATESGLVAGERRSWSLRLPKGGRFRAVLVWTDPPGVVRSPGDTTPQLVNDLDLRVEGSGVDAWGNGSSADRLNNVEVVNLANTPAGTLTVSVAAHQLRQGPRQSFALLMIGDFASSARVRAVRR